jgi:ribose 5-phosphate isomerase B
VLGEILDAWFAGAPSTEDDDRANVAHLDEI